VLVSCLGQSVAQSTVCTEVDNVAQKAKCQSQDGNSYTFDLSCIVPPSGLGGDPYFSDVPQDGSDYVYYFNFGGLPSTSFGRCTLPTDQAAGNVAAQATSDGALCYALGQQNTGGWSINTNLGSVTEYLKITYNAFGRNMELDVYCDPTAETPLYEPIGEDVNQGLYVFHITSKWACKENTNAAASCSGATPGKQRGKGGPGGALFGIFCGFAFVYFVGGYIMLGNQGKGGNDRIPHYSFWTSLPGLVKDGFAFTKGKLTGQRVDVDGTYAAV